jgi:ADP-ribosylglycohydrolase
MSNNSTQMSLPADHAARLERARLSLDGLSVGDAFGQRFFCGDSAEPLIAERAFPKPPWSYTDDTVMALAILEVLARRGGIDQEELARAFARRYRADPCRGYGGTAHGILTNLGAGVPWRVAAGEVFGGMGSMGNGGAMRVGPVGAYWADDYEAAAEQARASAQVTHAHPEGRAGAVAVAVAAAWATRRGSGQEMGPGRRLLEVALEYTPAGETRRGLEVALTLSPELSVPTAVSVLGNGLKVTSPDTVPFALWCAARHIDVTRQPCGPPSPGWEIVTPPVPSSAAWWCWHREEKAFPSPGWKPGRRRRSAEMKDPSTFSCRGPGAAAGIEPATSGLRIDSGRIADRHQTRTALL